jgi:hypothetical protein
VRTQQQLFELEWPEAPCEPTPPAPGPARRHPLPLNTEGWDSMKLARLEQALNKQWRFDGVVMSLREFLQTKELTEKSAHTRHYTRRRVHLAHERIKPKTEYTAWYGKCGMDVAKLVYDALDLPARVSEDYVS